MANSEEDQYPGVDAAYEIAIASYEVAIKRLDAIDGRIQTLMGFAITATALVISVSANKGFSFRSWLLYFAIALLAFAVAVATYARLHGSICLLEPKKFYERWLHKAEPVFKKDLIYFAGQHFDKNMSLVRRKWNLSLVAIALFALGAVFLAVWAVVHHP